MGEAIIVGIAEVKGTRGPADILIAPSLGSGVGICAYDAQERVAAIAHFILPESRDDEFACGKYADAAVPALHQALQGHDVAVRGPAAVSLGKIHGQPEVIIPLLIRYLDEDDLKEAAAEALGEYGSLSKTAIPKLLLLYKVRDKDLHHAVGEALNRIDPIAAAQVGARMDGPPPGVPKATDH